MDKLILSKMACIVFVFCAATAIASAATATFETLVGFDGTDGAHPYVMSLVQGFDGSFYGTTYAGGANNLGTVFKITSGGTLTTLHSFDKTDGANPNGGLVQATNGTNVVFYGTTYAGGANNLGTVFEITAGGTLTILHSFDRTDGANPEGGLVQATNGVFYGTTYAGGDNGDGTVFKITPGGTLTTLHSFDRTDGAKPNGELVQATNGVFYGTTYAGGDNGDGTVFEITAGGTLTTLHSLDGTDGAKPEGGLFQATNGNFYGTTYAGGDNIDGTVFSLSVGLGPFVETLPTSGKVFAAVTILGTNLTGATKVTFGGTEAARFSVVSNSEIEATVPFGAKTGTIEVTTPKGALKSNLIFKVLSGETCTRGSCDMCDPEFPPCCPGLVCSDTSIGQHCVPGGSTSSSATDSSFNPVNMDKLMNKLQ
jgi:uncharacterized repeat protein (TIGR03803 family)